MTKSKELPYGTPVRVVWIDSTGQNIGWVREQEVDVRVVTINSIGYVVGSNEQAVAMTHSIHKNGTAYDVFSIPKGCIESIEELDFAVEEQDKGE